jgi:hypothetical protein
MNLEDYMWRRAYSHTYGKYVKIVKMRPDSLGKLIYDAVICGEPPTRHMFRREELGNIQWIPYGSNR